MEEFDPIKYQEMVRTFQERDDPTGWFDSIYSVAEVMSAIRFRYSPESTASKHVMPWSLF